MANYKKRKERERQELAARAALSPLTPATPLREDLQPNLIADKDEPPKVKPIELEPPAPSGPEEGEVVAKTGEEKILANAADALVKTSDSTVPMTMPGDNSELKPVTSNGSTPIVASKTPPARPSQLSITTHTSAESSPSTLPPSLQRREPVKAAEPVLTAPPQQAKVTADGEAGTAPPNIPPTLPRAMRSSSNAPLPRAPRSLRDGSNPTSPTLSRRSGSPPPLTTTSSKQVPSGWRGRAASVGGSDTLEPPAPSAGSAVDSVASSSNGKSLWKRLDDPVPSQRSTGPPPTSSSGTAASGTAPAARRQPPSGPRALREQPSGPVRGRGPPPRGPLADRERGRRERDYDRSRDIPDSDEERHHERDRERDRGGRKVLGDRYSPQHWGGRSWGRGRR